MQTNTWMPALESARRPSWPEAIGWYLAGTFATVASWSVIGGLSQLVAPDVAMLLGHVLAIAAVVGLIRGTRDWPRRSRVALWLGIITPFVLAAIALGLFIYAVAHSNWF